MTKVKIPPEDRIYDRDGYWLRAACVCVKDHSENEVCLFFQFFVSFLTNSCCNVLTLVLIHAYSNLQVE